MFGEVAGKGSGELFFPAKIPAKIAPENPSVRYQ
jgi:hypothetical protein